MLRQTAYPIGLAYFPIDKFHLNVVYPCKTHRSLSPVVPLCLVAPGLAEEEAFKAHRGHEQGAFARVAKGVDLPAGAGDAAITCSLLVSQSYGSRYGCLRRVGGDDYGDESETIFSRAFPKTNKQKLCLAKKQAFFDRILLTNFY